ncbi:MAG: YceI family protein [Chloroflexi bacterium]|nr:YceI family protein [Chloroflexota bacterium]
MSKTIYLLALCALLITACGAQTPTDSPPESYPAPQQTESVQASSSQENTDDSVYPPPFHTATPVVSLGTSYPAPEGGMEVFVIVPGESEVSYEVGEVFLNQDNAFNLAIGVTSEVNGEILVDRDNLQNSTIGPIRIDVSQFTSDSQRRDNAIRERFLESAIFPIVEFTPREIQGLPESYQEGQQITFLVSGDLTVRDVTKPVTFEVSFVGEGDTMTGEATTTILMSDFGFGPISIGGILNTEDEVKVNFAFVARQ